MKKLLLLIILLCGIIGCATVRIIHNPKYQVDNLDTGKSYFVDSYIEVEEGIMISDPLGNVTIRNYKLYKAGPDQ